MLVDLTNLHSPIYVPTRLQQTADPKHARNLISKMLNVNIIGDKEMNSLATMSQ